MSARVKLIGTICGGSMSPTKTTEKGKKPFMRLHMSVPDETKPVDPKSSFRPSQVYQVILSSEKLFEYLVPQRRILVEGRQTHNARALAKGDQLTVYPNPVVYMDHLQFLTPQEEVQLERSLERLTKLGIISEEIAKEHTVKARQAIADQYEKDPPRRYINEGTDSNEVSSDPDHPDFAE